MKIRNQFIIPSAIALFIVFVVYNYYLSSVESKKNRTLLESRADEIAELVSLTSVYPIWNLNKKALVGNVEAIFTDQEIVKIVVKDGFGKPLKEIQREVKGKEIEKKQAIKFNDEVIGETEVTITDFYANKRLSETQGRFMAISAGVFIIILVIILIISNIVTKPIVKLTNYVQFLEKGDFTQNIDIKFNNELSVMGTALNNMVEKLREVLQSINDAQILINESSIEINDSNDRLAKEAYFQASSLEETSGAMEEMSEIVVRNLEKTKKANERTQEVARSVNIVGSDSQKLSNSMEEIIRSSKRIENILDVMDDISFQTNLLALNAAVEAARAGEKGRGFAVVAVEIRNLAGKSSKAAREVKDLIKESEIKIEEGGNLLKNTLQNLQKVIEEVNGVANFISEIATSVDEQERGISQVKKAISELEDITQNNSSIAEQTSSISHNLKEESERFSGIFKFFKLRGRMSATTEIKEVEDGQEEYEEDYDDNE